MAGWPAVHYGEVVMNPHASALGKQAKGVKKTMTPEAVAARQDNLIAARKKRWPAKKRRKPNA